MKKKDNQNIYSIRFPDRYSDPRDFYEAIIKTYLESKKLIATDKKKQFDQLLYLPVKLGMIGVWYVVICLGYILNDFTKVILLLPEAASKDITTIAPGIIHHEYASIEIVSNSKSSFGNKKCQLQPLNEQFGHIFSIFSCLCKLENIEIIKIGLKGNNVSISAGLADYFIDKIDKNTCVIVCADFEQEMKSPLMASYFENISQKQKRKSKAIQFTTDFGDMAIQAA